jgi:hypothetical protein
LRLARSVNRPDLGTGRVQSRRARPHPPAP